MTKKGSSYWIALFILIPTISYGNIANILDNKNTLYLVIFLILGLAIGSLFYFLTKNKSFNIKLVSKIIMGLIPFILIILPNQNNNLISKEWIDHEVDSNKFLLPYKLDLLSSKTQKKSKSCSNRLEIYNNKKKEKYYSEISRINMFRIMEKNNLTSDKIKNKFIELTDFLIFKDSKEKALNRIDNVFSNDNLKNIDDYKYELAREWNDSSGQVYEGVMFATVDWAVNTKDFIWEINKILGDTTKSINFPTEEEVRNKGGYYSSDLLCLFASSLKKEGITMASLGTEMDYAIHYFVNNKDFDKVYNIFKEIGADPLTSYEE